MEKIVAEETIPMKSTYILLCCLGIAGAGHSVCAESVSQFTGGGPETTLDSIWAASAYSRALSETATSQISMARFQDEKKSRLWGSAMASFGDAGVRNDHPAFDYSAGGYAIGYDYSNSYNRGSGLILGLALGQMFGHQNIEEMTDHPDGVIPSDRYRQISFGADFYGAVLQKITPKSHLIISLDAGLNYMENKCQHPDEWNDMSKWNTDTYFVTFATSWRYDVTESFSVMPFTKISYMHADNKKRRDEDGSFCSGHHDWDDDTCNESHWDNRGKFDNITLELGLTLEHVIRFSQGKAWVNSLSGSYCPDILRNDPHYTFNDTWWEGDTMYQSQYKGKGYSADRQAFKVKFLSRISCSENLSVFASYQACLRESYTEHQVALGVSSSF